MMIPKSEQSDAILNATEWRLAEKYCTGDMSSLQSWLTVTRDDLRTHIAAHGYPHGWWRFETATFDGLYTVENNGVWIVYVQERGQIEHGYPQEFRTKAEAVDFVLDTVYLKVK